jgi:hypothetical protein
LSSVLLTQVKYQKTRSPSVQDAHCFRVQAELYFELARRMSLAQDAEYCRVTAERHISQAVDLEKHQDSVSTPSSDAHAIARGRMGDWS